MLVAQAGLVEVLVRKFRSAGALCAAYVAASVALHAAWLLDKWAAPHAVSTPLLICLFTLQRCRTYAALLWTTVAVLLIVDTVLCVLLSDYRVN